MQDADETTDIEYSVTDLNIKRYFTVDITANDENDFWLIDDFKFLGAVVTFNEYPDHETLTWIFNDLLIRAVMLAQEADGDEARGMLDEYDTEAEFPADLNLAETFSLFFIVEGHQGLYRMLLQNNDHWVGHSTGKKSDRWDV
jgi:hypothetical protein